MKQLKARTKQEWEKIDPSVLKNLIHSMSDTLEAVKEANGGQT